MTHEIAVQAARNSKGPAQLEFSRLGKLNVEVVCDEPELRSDGGALILREAAEANGIIDAMAEVIEDDRNQAGEIIAVAFSTLRGRAATVL